jgi:hypothetical protein
LTHLHWLYVHILLFVFWLGADVGVYLSMFFVKDARLSFATRAAIIRLAFYIDLSPRFAFALMIPVGTQLASNLGLVAIGPVGRAVAWLVGLGWCALHFATVRYQGTPLAARLRGINVGFEWLAGLAFAATGAASLAGVGPLANSWFAGKILLFGLVFLVVVGIDTKFQPFTLLLRAGPDGLTADTERAITRATNQTLAWALLLYVLILAIAWLGKLKPF